jgi:hypothetical protein
VSRLQLCVGIFMLLGSVNDGIAAHSPAAWNREKPVFYEVCGLAEAIGASVLIATAWRKPAQQTREGSE